VEASGALARRVSHTSGNDLGEPGVRGLYAWEYLSRRRAVCRSDSVLSAVPRARSEAAPCRRAPGRSGPAPTGRECTTSRRCRILGWPSEPRRLHGSHRCVSGLRTAACTIDLGALICPVRPLGHQSTEGADDWLRCRRKATPRLKHRRNDPDRHCRHTGWYTHGGRSRSGKPFAGCKSDNTVPKYRRGGVKLSTRCPTDDPICFRHPPCEGVSEHT
jgi:hypothetical protein